MDIHRLPTFDEVERLRREAGDLERALIFLLPKRHRKALVSFQDCATRAETVTWRKGVVDAVVANADIVTDPVRGRLATCPFCGVGLYEYYYEFPGELRSHLGDADDPRNCVVMNVIHRIAQGCWDIEFKAHEREDRRRDASTESARKHGTMLYQVHPYERPKLAKDVSIWRKPRTAARLVWAENRLTELGFETATENNVRSYILKRPDVIVYADPLEEGLIAFYVAKAPLLQGRPSREGLYVSRFHLQDRWRQDLRGKLEQRISDNIPFWPR